MQRRQIGRTIYYDKTTGDVLVDTGERSGHVVETTREQDFETYKALSERVPETVGHIELQYGQYNQDFRESNGCRVNPQTQKIEFTYPDPSDPEPPTEPEYREPLSERISDLESENANMLMQNAQDQIRIGELESEMADMLLMIAGGAPNV